jgi:hypothetical protein
MPATGWQLIRLLGEFLEIPHQPLGLLGAEILGRRDRHGVGTGDLDGVDDCGVDADDRYLGARDRDGAPFGGRTLRCAQPDDPVAQLTLACEVRGDLHRRLPGPDDQQRRTDSSAGARATRHPAPRMSAEQESEQPSGKVIAR